MPVPTAVIKLLISALFKTLSSLAFSTFKSLPRRGSIACVNRSLPCFADPPAESPSTIYNSLFEGSFSEQSANFPGNPPPDSAPFLTVSRAFLAASRALAAFTTFSIIAFA